MIVLGMAIEGGMPNFNSAYKYLLEVNDSTFVKMGLQVK